MSAKSTIKKIFKMPEASRKPPSFLDRHALLFHIPFALLLCFVIEAISRHSALDSLRFIVNEPVAYIYNSYIIFVFLTICFLTRRQAFVRILVAALFIAMGIANGIILLNRVTPFGFSDIGMIGDLLTMQNTGYMSKGESIVIIAAIVVFWYIMKRKFHSCKRIVPRMPMKFRLLFVVLAFASLPLVTTGLQSTRLIDSYFGNLARGYLDNGYLYGFAMSAFGRGMSTPKKYSADTVAKITKEDDRYAEENQTDFNATSGPNIVVMLLESYLDPSEVKFLDTSEDPNPFFHYLEQNYSTGHLTVPVVGAGTCNTEFEILTGMSCRFFGPGEYPQKTILKKTDCESFAADLHTVGYGTHVVHNNGGNFYSRRNAFSMMGFDSFTCKEMLDITEYNPLNSWPLDYVLTDATKEAMDNTPQSDFVYTITVETHGDYPTYKVFDNPEIKVKARGKDEETKYKWEYYVNMIHDQDKFLKSYIDMLSKRNEPTLFIAFGDHIPTMGLTDRELKSGDTYKTKYITWNNFGMEKHDQDLTSYQLVSQYLNRLGFHDGTMLSYNQRQMADGVAFTSNAYSDNLEMLQYDLLYGKRYAYGDDKDKYPASNIVMGTHDITVDRAYLFGGKLHIYGDGFTKWSRVFVNGHKVSTAYQSGQHLTIDGEDIRNADLIQVKQIGSSDTVFRESNELVYIVHSNAARMTAIPSLD